MGCLCCCPKSAQQEEKQKLLNTPDGYDVYISGRGIHSGPDCVPQLISSLRDKGVSDASCGTHHSAFITSGGEVMSILNKEANTIASPVLLSGQGPYTTVSVGRSLICAITMLGEVYSCSAAKNETHPGSCMLHADEHISGVSVKRLFFGDAVVLALDDSGIVYSWGTGLFGELGQGDAQDKKFPTAVEGIPESVVRMDVGHHHVACVTKSGALYTWGEGTYGALGLGNDKGQRVPKQVKGNIEGMTIVDVACGSNFTVVVTDTGKVFSFGFGGDGGLGIPGKKRVNKPYEIKAFRDKGKVTSLACGSRFACAVTERGEVYAWGFNATGVLGTGVKGNKDRPTLLDGMLGKRVVRVLAGDDHMLLLATNGPTSFGAMGHSVDAAVARAVYNNQIMQ